MRLSVLLLAAAFGMSACTDGNPDPGDTDEPGPVGSDLDGDGIEADVDCDDADATIGGPGIVYADTDGDGFGDPAVTDTACEVGPGTSDNDLDCDDGNSAIHPDATEVCDGADVDEDCDALVDDADPSVSGQLAYFVDTDGDSYGDDAEPVLSCEAVPGHVLVAGDCDDSSAAFNPGAAELDCTDPADYNCDGSTGFADEDGDTFAACEECDDTNAAINPDAAEICNDIDDNCNGDIDTDTVGAPIWYADLDSDGFGDHASPIEACDAPVATVANADDCDDTRASINPAGTEICDDADLDEDCDGASDDSDDSVSDARTWYRDVDADLFGVEGSTAAACDQPAGYAAAFGDCDDASAAYNPGASEDDCTDPADYNCDGSVSYADLDSDGHAACEDCDDTVASTYPGAEEICDGADNNCDSEIDEDSAIDAGTWYADSDTDGFGDATVAAISCDAPFGYVADGTDCDDDATTTHPDASEICNEIDDNCDGTEDEGLEIATWYADVDGDGLGDAASSLGSCGMPAGYVADATDCNDGDTTVGAGTPSYADIDADGFGNAAESTIACEVPDGYVADATDCDDTTSDVHPDAVETCNGYDDNCDGTVDNDATDALTWYRDADADTYGNAAVSSLACEAPDGYIADSDDCNDASAAIHPAADEICNGADDNCDGALDDDDSGTLEASMTTWYVDADLDGFGDDLDEGLLFCADPSDDVLAYVADNSDCNDEDIEVSCNGCTEIEDYIVCTDEHSWSAAQRTCEVYGANLVTVNDDLENEALNELLDAELGPYWIGLGWNSDATAWVWADASPYEYSAWSVESDDGSDGICATTNSGVWDTPACTELRSFVCELGGEIPPA